MKKINFFLVLFLILFVFSGCSPKKINPCNTSNKIADKIYNDYKNKIVCFKTIDSYDLDYLNSKDLIIFGHLTYPKIKKETYNAIILSHGSGGIRRYHEKYVNLLNDNGYVVFQIDHYTARNIKYDKTFSKVSGITFMNDSFKALKLLKTNPAINKIAYIGWSQGGVGPILSHFKPITAAVNNDEDIFDASIAIYPYCGFTFPDNTPTHTPLLMITGNADELTPERACRNLFSKFFKNKNKIFHTSLPNAHHGFDNPFLYFGFTFEKLPSLNIINKNCTLTISNAGKIITLNNEEVTTPKASEKFLHRCSAKGVTVKYNAQATKKSQNIILNFLSRIFK